MSIAKTIHQPLPRDYCSSLTQDAGAFELFGRCQAPKKPSLVSCNVFSDAWTHIDPEADHKDGPAQQHDIPHSDLLGPGRGREEGREDQRGQREK